MGGRSKKKQAHPPHLTGRDIGLYYRDLNRERQKAETSKIFGPSITLSDEKVEEIRNYLKINSSVAENVNLNNLIHNDLIESEFKQLFLKINYQTFEEQLMENIAYSFQESSEEMAKLEETNIKLYEEYYKKLANENFQKMLMYRRSLPTFQYEEQILRLVSENQVVVISGDTGCGKTTQVAQYILDEHIKNCRGAKCRILCTQPRRISAISVAERVAEERIEPLGSSVGYQIRLENYLPRPDGGTILYCTAGVLIKFLESDKALSNISHLILDEIHERDTISDLTLGIVKKILVQRKNLKVIIMSATMRAELFATYFNYCPIIRIDGKLYPIESVYLEDIIEKLRFFKFDEKQPKLPIWVMKKNQHQVRSNNHSFESFMEPYIRSIDGIYSREVLNALRNPGIEKINIELIEALIYEISMKNAPGAILVFLPGYDKILKLFNHMKNSNRYPEEYFEIFTLHSMLPGVDQKRVFLPLENGARKIILATNIAETSITINDVVYVIDSGKRKLTTYNTEKNIQTLEEEWVTKAHLIQRKGRAGRVQPGVCYHLYTRAREYTFQEYPKPEILCTRLDNTILSIKLLSLGDPYLFLSTLLDSPDEQTVEKSVKLLKRLNALDENEALTPLGLHLAQLPLAPQIGKMILMGAIFSCVDPITSIAASLSFKDPFYRPLGKNQEVDDKKRLFASNTRSDHLMLVNIMKQWRDALRYYDEDHFCYDNFLSKSILSQLNQMKKQFCEHLKTFKFINSPDPDFDGSNLNSDNKKLLKAIICSGMYPNIAKIRSVKEIRKGCYVKISVQTIEKEKVQIHPTSVNAQERDFESNFLVYNMKQKSTAIYLYDTTMVNPWSILFFGDMFEMTVEHGKEHVSVAGNIYFPCNAKVIALIKDLRDGLNLLLQKKLCQPSPIDWDHEEGTILKAIIHLITLDGKPEYYDSDSD